MAGLIPQSFIDELLDRVDIVEVIDRRVPLKKAGKSYKACCPFHNEKTPSFNVNADRQFYHCFGCGAGGNALGFVMDFDNVDFPEAVDTLAGSLGLEVPREQQSPIQRQQQKQKQSIYDALQFASLFYQQALRQHPDKNKTINYLKQRGLSGEIARDFIIGFAPAGWDNLLQKAKNDPDFNEHIEQIEAAGLIIKKENGDYYDRFRERVIFPIRDNRGRVIAFGGRVLGDDKPKYLNSPESSVFHKQRELYGLYEARKQNATLDMLVLVEGYMDVVSLFQYGINYAVATLGTASSQFHLEKIFRHTSRLVVCFDGDEAGEKAAQRLLETALPAMQDGREISFLFLPEGEDPDTFIRNKGKQAFAHALDTAKPLEELLFETEQENISLDSDAGKARFNNKLLKRLTSLPNGFFKQSQLKKLAALTGTDISLLQSRLDEYSQNKTPPQKTELANNSQAQSVATKPARPSSSPPSNISDQNEQAKASNTVLNTNPDMTDPAVILAISSLLHFPELALQTKPPKSTQANTEALTVLDQLYNYIRQTEAQSGTPPTSYKIFGHWHGTEIGQLLARCATVYIEPDNLSIAQQQLEDALSNLEKRQQNKPLQSFIENLTSKSSPTKLSEQEKAMLRNIGRDEQKH